jgi:toxoflavin biosynthesis protein ToxD
MTSSLEALLPPFVCVPAGPFLIGTPVADLSRLAKAYGGTRESYREESPQHAVELPAYAIAVYPVSVGLYAAFVAATGARAPLRWHGTEPPDALRDHPVSDVTWHEARACCQWLAEQLGQRYRLPSEAEWEKAARGTTGRSFPWGEEWDDARANTREGARGTTTPCGALDNASPYGCYDMAGNVWEWTASLDAPYPYHADDGREMPEQAGRRILRGGCYANPHGFARCACRFRLPPAISNEFLGFRLVR